MKNRINLDPSTGDPFVSASVANPLTVSSIVERQFLLGQLFDFGLFQCHTRHQVAVRSPGKTKIGLNPSPGKFPALSERILMNRLGRLTPRPGSFQFADTLQLLLLQAFLFTDVQILVLVRTILSSVVFLV